MESTHQPGADRATGTVQLDAIRDVWRSHGLEPPPVSILETLLRAADDDSILLRVLRGLAAERRLKRYGEMPAALLQLLAFYGSQDLYSAAAVQHHADPWQQRLFSRTVGRISSRLSRLLGEFFSGEEAA